MREDEQLNQWYMINQTCVVLSERGKPSTSETVIINSFCVMVMILCETGDIFGVCGSLCSPRDCSPTCCCVLTTT